MPNTQVEEFEDYKIVEGSIQFEGESAIGFGCIGTINGTANIEEIIKKCEGAIVKKIKRVTDIAVELSGHAKIPASRKIMGLSNEGLKAGVYAYGTDTFSKPFVFAAKVLDMEGNTKYIAFSNMTDVKGLILNINNEVTEIEMKDFNFSALADTNKKFYYEAYESELEDNTVKQQWLTNFTPELVKNTEDSQSND